MSFDGRGPGFPDEFVPSRSGSSAGSDSWNGSDHGGQSRSSSYNGNRAGGNDGERWYSYDDDDDGEEEFSFQEKSNPALEIHHDCTPCSLDSVEAYDIFDMQEKVSDKQISKLIEEFYDRLYDPDIEEKEKREAEMVVQKTEAEKHHDNLIRRHNFETHNRPQAVHRPVLLSEWTTMFPRFRVVGNGLFPQSEEEEQEDESSVMDGLQTMLYKPAKADGRLTPPAECYHARWAARKPRGSGDEEDWKMQQRLDAIQWDGEYNEEEHGDVTFAEHYDDVRERGPDPALELMVIGHGNVLVELPEGTEDEEEIFAMHGTVEETFAMLGPEVELTKKENDEWDEYFEKRRQAGFPPIEPKEAIVDEHLSRLFDVLWVSIIPALEPAVRALVRYSWAVHYRQNPHLQQRLAEREPEGAGEDVHMLKAGRPPRLRGRSQRHYLSITDETFGGSARGGNGEPSSRARDGANHGNGFALSKGLEGATALSSLMKITSMNEASGEPAAAHGGKSKKVWGPDQGVVAPSNEHDLMWTGGSFVGGALMQSKLKRDINAEPTRLTVGFSGGGYRMHGNNRRPAAFDAHRRTARNGNLHPHNNFSMGVSATAKELQLPTLQGGTSKSSNVLSGNGAAVMGGKRRVHTAGNDKPSSQFNSSHSGFESSSQQLPRIHRSGGKQL
jgi:hypothetical protein